MIYVGRLLLCAALSVVAHLLFERAAEHLPRLPEPERQSRVTVRLVEPPPPPEPPPPEPEKAPPVVVPPPPPKPIEAPRLVKKTSPVAKALPPPVKQESLAEPQRGDPRVAELSALNITMDSTSTLGVGSVPAGSGALGRPGSAAVGPGQASGKPTAAAPVPAYEVTRMPIPEGRCSGTYTEDARQAGIEGTVVLDVVVGADGKTSDITVVQGLGHGLTEAAIVALKGCRFAPGERNGEPVPVRVRGFKITFVLAKN